MRHWITSLWISACLTTSAFAGARVAQVIDNSAKGAVGTLPNPAEATECDRLAAACAASPNAVGGSRAKLLPRPGRRNRRD
jgi:hypothetical protein